MESEIEERIREFVYHGSRGLGVDVEGTQSSAIDLLFGKTIEKLSCSDVRVLVEAGAVESPRLEFKEGAATEEGLVKLIMKSVVGFLNSDMGEGVLILGVGGREHAEKLVCVPRALLGQDRDIVESKVRNWVFSYLASIPPMVTAPRLLVKVFDCRDCGLEAREGWIVLVYVKKAFDSLYYSKADNTAYQRRGNETRRLTLEEAIRIVNAKRQPILLVFVEPVAMEGDRVKLDLLARNIGSAPANVGVSTVRVHRKAKILPSFLETDLSISMYGGLSELAEDQEAIRFQVDIGSPLTLPVFPEINARIGRVEIAFKEKLLKGAYLGVIFIVNTLTELNHTIQACTLILDSTTKYAQACFAITKDYIGNTIFETRAEEGELVLCDKQGVRIVKIEGIKEILSSKEELSSLLKTLATILLWDIQPRPPRD